MIKNVMQIKTMMDKFKFKTVNLAVILIWKKLLSYIIDFVFIEDVRISKFKELFF